MGPHGEDDGAAYSGFGDFPKAMAKALSAAHLLLNHRSSVSSGFPSSSKVVGIGAAKIGGALTSVAKSRRSPSEKIGPLGQKISVAPE